MIVAQTPDYTQLLSDLTEHGNLRKACRDNGIVRTTFLDHVDADADLADQYTRAKQRGIDNMMEELLDAEVEDAGKARLEWDRKRWHASKLYWRRYGDKQTLEHSGPNGTPIQTETRLDTSGLSDGALREIASLGAKAGEK